MVTKNQILENLKQITDPELGHNIVDLGFVYRVEPKDDGTVEIDLTLTTPACPLAGVLYGNVVEKVNALPGVTDVKVNLVWDPPWTPEKINPELRTELGM